MNNTTNRIEIPVTIFTEFAFESEEQKARLRIEQTGMYIAALFSLLKTSVRGYDLLDIKTDYELFEFTDFRGNVGLISELGEALADQLSGFTCTLAVLENERLEEERSINEI